MLQGDPEGELNDEGLTSAEAELLLQKWGRNELPEKKKSKFELLMELVTVIKAKARSILDFFFSGHRKHLSVTNAFHLFCFANTNRSISKMTVPAVDVCFLFYLFCFYFHFYFVWSDNFCSQCR